MRVKSLGPMTGDPFVNPQKETTWRLVDCPFGSTSGTRLVNLQCICHLRDADSRSQPTPLESTKSVILKILPALPRAKVASGAGSFTFPIQRHRASGDNRSVTVAAQK